MESYGPLTSRMPVIGHHFANAVLVFLPQPPNAPRVYTAGLQDTFADIHSENIQPPQCCVWRRPMHRWAITQNELRTCTPLIKNLYLLPMKYLISILRHLLFDSNELINYLCVFSNWVCCQNADTRTELNFEMVSAGLEENYAKQKFYVEWKLQRYTLGQKLKSPQRAPLLDGVKSNLNPPSRELRIWRWMP